MKILHNLLTLRTACVVAVAAALVVVVLLYPAAAGPLGIGLAALGVLHQMSARSRR